MMSPTTPEDRPPAPKATSGDLKVHLQQDVKGLGEQRPGHRGDVTDVCHQGHSRQQADPGQMLQGITLGSGFGQPRVGRRD
jgi:hypothetical protein